MTSIPAMSTTSASLPARPSNRAAGPDEDLWSMDAVQLQAARAGVSTKQSLGSLFAKSAIGLGIGGALGGVLALSERMGALGALGSVAGGAAIVGLLTMFLVGHGAFPTGSQQRSEARAGAAGAEAEARRNGMPTVGSPVDGAFGALAAALLADRDTNGDGYLTTATGRDERVRGLDVMGGAIIGELPPEGDTPVRGTELLAGIDGGADREVSARELEAGIETRVDRNGNGRFDADERAALDSLLQVREWDTYRDYRLG